MDMAGNFVESRFAIDRPPVSGGRRELTQVNQLEANWAPLFPALGDAQPWRVATSAAPDTADRADRTSLRTHAPCNLSGHLRPNSPPIMPPIRPPGPPPPPLR